MKLTYTPNTTEDFTIGPNYRLDPGVIIGYIGGRQVDSLRLEIGDNARLRSGTVIYAGSRIGHNLETGHNVIIREEVVIGNNVHIWNNSTILPGCRIGNNVTIHHNVPVGEYSTIEDDVFIAPGVTTPNDPHPICTYCIEGPWIKRGAKIGAGVTLLPHVTIGEYALVGAGSVVAHDVPPRTLVFGNPAQVIKSVDEMDCPFEIIEHPYLNGIDVGARGLKPLKPYRRRNAPPW